MKRENCEDMIEHCLNFVRRHIKQGEKVPIVVFIKSRTGTRPLFHDGLPENIPNTINMGAIIERDIEVIGVVLPMMRYDKSENKLAIISARDKNDFVTTGLAYKGKSAGKLIKITLPTPIAEAMWGVELV